MAHLCYAHANTSRCPPIQLYFLHPSLPLSHASCISPFPLPALLQSYRTHSQISIRLQSIAAKITLDPCLKPKPIRKSLVNPNACHDSSCVLRRTEPLLVHSRLSIQPLPHPRMLCSVLLVLIVLSVLSTESTKPPTFCPPLYYDSCTKPVEESKKVKKEGRRSSETRTPCQSCVPRHKLAKCMHQCQRMLSRVKQG